MLTVFILASRIDERYIKEFWAHLVMCRRTMQGITWANPLYVEDLQASEALVPRLQGGYVVIGCLSPRFLAMLFEQPAIREMVEQARLKIPFIVSECEWDKRPCPFAGKVPLSRKAIASASNRDSLFTEMIQLLRRSLA